MLSVAECMHLMITNTEHTVLESSDAFASRTQDAVAMCPKFNRPEQPLLGEGYR